MINALQEFLKHTKGKEIKAALLKFRIDYDEDGDIYLYRILKQRYTQDEMFDFYDGIDRDYDNGFGIQNLYGNIWYEDGTWSERFEYDGAEKWVCKQCPPVIEEITESKK